jgi:hypothetical protein
MTWMQIGQDHLRAAKQLVRQHPRSAVSRAYYAAHVTLTQRLSENGWVAPANRQTPEHHRQSFLAGQFLASPKAPRQLIAGLYRRRLDADYNKRSHVGHDIAIQAVREACELFYHLRVTEVQL